jgi:hypothetical protein
MNKNRNTITSVVSSIFLVFSPLVFSVASAGWELPPDQEARAHGASNDKEYQKAKKTYENDEDHAAVVAAEQKAMEEESADDSTGATLDFCILMVPFNGPSKVLKDEECKKAVKAECSISRRGTIRPSKCAVFPASFY